MANSIAYSKAYTAMIDRINKEVMKTTALNARPGTFKPSESNSRSILLRELAVEGLGAYSRSTGYTGGDTDISWREYIFTQERSKSNNIDARDLIEAQTEVAEVASEFQRISVAPEIDAYRFESIVTACSADATENLTYDNVIHKINEGIKTLNDAECPEDGRVLYVDSDTEMSMDESGEFTKVIQVNNNNNTVDTRIMSYKGMPIVGIPSTRFCSNFDFSATDGFSKAVGSHDLNFVIAHAPSALGIIKVEDVKIIEPKNNFTGNFWFWAYLLMHDLFIPHNKLNNFYISQKVATN